MQLLTAASIGIWPVACLEAAYFRFGDVRDWISYNGSSGTHHATIEEDGVHLGAKDTIFEPGEIVAWTAKACLREGRHGHGHLRLYRPAQMGSPEIPGDEKSAPLAADRCGERISWLKLPDDALPGTWVIRRWFTARDEGLMAGLWPFWQLGWWPLREDYPTIVVHVVSRRVAQATE